MKKNEILKLIFVFAIAGTPAFAAELQEADSMMDASAMPEGESPKEDSRMDFLKKNQRKEEASTKKSEDLDSDLEDVKPTKTQAFAESKNIAAMDDEFMSDMMKRDQKLQEKDSMNEEKMNPFADQPEPTSMPQNNPKPEMPMQPPVQMQQPVQSPASLPMPMMTPQMQMPMPMMMPQMQMPMPMMSNGAVDPNMVYFYAYSATAKAIQDALPQVLSQMQRQNPQSQMNPVTGF